MNKNRNLYFIDSDGKYHLLHRNVKENEVSILSNVFLDERSIKSYYKRYWRVKDGVKIDFGSHTEFFLWGNVEE